MTQTRLAGSCLCGSVKYEIIGTATRFYHCHCSRCRKASGTGHASNLLIETDTVSWLKGETLLSHYKVPQAERFMTCFCKHCGSPLPRYLPAMRLAVIPAGSLDTEPELLPQARIFWGSRAQWSCHNEDLPLHDEYP